MEHAIKILTWNQSQQQLNKSTYATSGTVNRETVNCLVKWYNLTHTAYNLSPFC